MQSLSPAQAALLVAVLGSLAAAAVPTFVENLHASRLVEPVHGLERIGARAVMLAAGRAPEVAFPASVELTPAEVPHGERVSDPPGIWRQPTWLELDFRAEDPHAYSFAFESRNAPGQATFRAWAHGDLDGDGLYSTFQIWGESREGELPRLYPMDIYREVE